MNPSYTTFHTPHPAQNRTSILTGVHQDSMIPPPEEIHGASETRTPTEAARLGLLAHCGAALVTREQLFSIETPEPTSTWQPVAHASLLCHVERWLTHSRLRIIGSAHALTHNGMRYFGVLQIQGQHTEDKSYTWVIGIRNSHDKQFPASLCMGTQVLVCDNLCFNGEITLSRKHTRFVHRDLDVMIPSAIGTFQATMHQEDMRIAAYRQKRITSKNAHDLAIRAIDQGIITCRQLPALLGFWRNPLHADFHERNLWSFFNAFTEVFKDRNPHHTVRQGMQLHHLCDSVCSPSKTPPAPCHR